MGVYESLPDELKEIGKENGLSIRIIVGRLKRGWGYERAVTEPSRWKPKTNAEAQAEWAAEKNGISLQVFKDRRYHGWTLKDASTIPIGKCRKSKTIRKDWRKKS